jgi:hypothetical protein
MKPMNRLFALVAMAAMVMAAGCGQGTQPKESLQSVLDTSAIKQEAETHLNEGNLRTVFSDNTMPSKYQLKLFKEGGTDTVEVHGKIGEVPL